MEWVLSGGRRAVSASLVVRIVASEVAGHSWDAVKARAGILTTGGTILGPEPLPRRAKVIPVSG